MDGMLRISDEHHKPSRFLRGLAESGIKAMALTDHGNLYGVRCISPTENIPIKTNPAPDT